jgi:hypothetical protein
MPSGRHHVLQSLSFGWPWELLIGLADLLDCSRKAQKSENMIDFVGIENYLQVLWKVVWKLTWL